MTDPEPASPPCQAPPGYWDEEETKPADDKAVERPAASGGSGGTEAEVE